MREKIDEMTDTAMDEFDETHSELSGDFIIFYGVEIDAFMENPLEMYDGAGMIKSLNSRHINSIRADEAREELLYNPYAVPLSYFEHGQAVWDVEGQLDNLPDFRWDGTSFAGIWVPDGSEVIPEHIGELTEAHDIYTCKRCEAAMDYNPSTECPECGEVAAEWQENYGEDLFAHESVLWPSAEQRVKIRQCAAEACKVYTNWINGEMFVIRVRAYRHYSRNGHTIECRRCYWYDDPVYDDAVSVCGTDHIEEELRNRLLACCDTLEKCDESND